VALQFLRFFQQEAASGIILLVAVLLALGWANSQWHESYFRLWETKLTVRWGSFVCDQDLHFWINEGLMAIFFFVIGLEIKREFLTGELSSLRVAALPVFAALGGMVVPAIIYLAFNASGPGAHGWGIPMATDIAFAIGAMAILGKRIPFAIKVFLTALAVVDDIGAVLVIAIFYTSSISWSSLAVAGLLFALLVLSNKAGIRPTVVYLILGLGIWLAFIQSGIHATIAGVLLAMTIPSRLEEKAAGRQKGRFSGANKNIFTSWEQRGGGSNNNLQNPEPQVLPEPRAESEDYEAPLQKLEHLLLPWVSFGVVPIFALANAGVRLKGLEGNLLGTLADPVGVGIITGLVLGKQIGITLFSWLAVRWGLASIPAPVSWRQIHGAACLAGIGFTMSLFIAILAFGGSPMLAISKISILTASLISGILGYVLLVTANSPDDNL
jgi:NhaA family Na+:H+ antiporter